MYEFLAAISRKKHVPQVDFIYTCYNEFKAMIKKMKEKTTSSPSGCHIGHYKVLSEMKDDNAAPYL